MSNIRTLIKTLCWRIKNFLVLQIRKSIPEEIIFAKLALNKFHFLNLVNIVFLDLVNFIMIDKFSILLLL